MRINTFYLQPVTCNYQKYHAEDDNSVASHSYQITSSKGSVRVGNISTLKVKSVPSKQSTIDSKLPPNNIQNSNHNVADITHVIDKPCTMSPYSCMDSHITKSQDESDNSLSEDGCKENTESQSSPVTTYVATPEDMKIIAGACYEYVMDKLENGDPLDPVIEDDKPYEEDKVLYDLDEELTGSAEKVSNLPAADVQVFNNNEDMQCLAMACYEAVMDMLRSGKVHSADGSDLENSLDDDKPIYYLDVEPSDSYELPLYAHSPSRPVNTGDTQHHCHHGKTASEVISLADKTASQQTPFQSLVVAKEDTTVNIDSADSLVMCNKQVNSDLEYNNERAAITLKVDDSSSKKSMTKEISSDNLCKYCFCC